VIALTSFTFDCIQGVFCDGTRRYGVAGNEKEECILIFYVNIAVSYNKSWRTGTFWDLLERNSKNV